MHKFLIKNSDKKKGGRRQKYCSIKAPNGETVFHSETVFNLQDEKEMLANFIRAVQSGVFRVEDADGEDITAEFKREFGIAL